MQSHPSSVTEAPAEPSSVSRYGSRSGLWLLASVLAVVAMIAARLIREPRFLFWDDTQLGAFGQWYGLGSHLLRGELPLLSPGSWQGGNYLAEGQWGVWNPLTWVVALIMHVGDGATLAVTAVKVAFLVALCVGAFLLARAYGAAPHWAALAGFTATAGGQTIFMDAPSWVTGLQTVTLFAFLWWALKRHLDDGMTPLPYFVFAYLLVTIGYVFAVLEIAALLLAFLAFALIARDGRRALRIVLLGAFPALLAIFVYLPGILTAPVTQRSGSDILNDQFLNMDLGDLATSPIATAVSSVRGYWGDLLPVPLAYVTWLLPLLVLVGPGWRRGLASLRVPLVVLAVTLALVVGPSVIGPLRYPARMMPYAVLAIAVCIAVIFTHAWPKVVSRRRAVIAGAAVALSAWLSWAAQPASWPIVVVGALVQVAVLTALLWPRLGARGPRVAAAWLLVGSLIVLAPQIARYPTSPLGNFNVPSSVSDMKDVASEMSDGIFVVGDVYSLQRDPRAYRESLIANLWYTTGKDVASVYTVLPFTRYAQDLCVDLRGWTCPGAFTALFAADADGSTIADDMALNTVIVIKGPDLTEVTVPDGWRLDDGEFTWTLHRVDPVARAGGIARTDAGVSVSDVTWDATTVSFRVDEVPDGGGDVVFSRLAWPGYSASGASLVDPQRGFLLTARVDAAQAGQIVTVRFLPPGWGLELAAAGMAGVLAAAYAIWFAVERRRRGVSAR
ncbi:hypothetical protein ACF044_12755 [Microbacterium sp. NPDC016588]